MTKTEMFDAISTAWQRSPPGQTVAQCAFIAGMRAAATLAGNPNALSREVIRATADRLESESP